MFRLYHAKSHFWVYCTDLGWKRVQWIKAGSDMFKESSKRKSAAETSLQNKSSVFWGVLVKAASLRGARRNEYKISTNSLNGEYNSSFTHFHSWADLRVFYTKRAPRLSRSELSDVITLFNFHLTFTRPDSSKQRLRRWAKLFMHVLFFILNKCATDDLFTFSPYSATEFDNK